MDKPIVPDCKVTFHVPTEQYGFVEFEGYSNNLETLEALYNRYSNKPLSLQVTTTGTVLGREVITFTGDKLFYDAIAHKYKTMDGKPLVSGSAYAEHFAKPFNRDLLAEKTAKKLMVPTQQVIDAWSLRGDIGRTFGTSIHKVMECWFKYSNIGYGLPKHPLLKQMVETFPLKDQTVWPELMVSDLARGLVGQIDGVHVINHNEAGQLPTVRIIDYKSDAEIKKNLSKHFHQLSFYAHILIAAGYEVIILEVWNYTDRWESYQSPVLPLDMGAVESLRK